MKSLLVAVFATAFCVACGTKRNEERCLEGLCSNPDLPFCDIDGSVAGEPNSCIAVDCSPGETAGCRDDRALTCNTAGDNYDLLQCPSGCDPAIGCKPCNTPECEKHIIPKYLPTICDQLSPADPVTITQDTTIDNTNALNCGSIVPQSNGVEICVLRYSALTLEANRTLKFTGPRAVAIVVDRDFTMAGILDVSAHLSTNGPGGGVIRSGTCSTGGCGGAGYRTPGGSGAGTGAAGTGGAAQPSPVQLVEIHGGTRSNTGTSFPGGGGGAATLISCRGNLTVTGMIDANGGGGSGDRFQSGYKQPGGGGSGGTIVLQGMRVMATGQFYANGGGGGGACGTCSLGQSGGTGDDGPRSTNSALGGSTSGGASGGRGGSQILAAEDGAVLPTNADYGGAGGGSAGFLLAYGPSSDQVVLSPIAASPAIFAAGAIPTN